MGEKHLHDGAIYRIKPSQHSLIWNPLFQQGTSEAELTCLALILIFTVDILYFVSDSVLQFLPSKDWYT